jgi:MSHA biogenesis protein MshG
MITSSSRPLRTTRSRPRSDDASFRIQGARSGGRARGRLFTRGITPIDIKPTRSPAAPGAPWYEKLFEERIKPEELMFFSRQMYTLLRAGVPILRALAGLQESTRNKKLAAVITDIRDDLDAGHELSATFARHPRVFSNFYVSMVRVGEQTGHLEDIFLRMFHHIEFERFMRTQIKSAVRYPTFVIATMAIALVIINLFVIPAFAKVYKGMNAQLPAMTQLLLGFSEFMVATWPLLLAGLVGAVFGFRRWTRTARGKHDWDRWKLKIPIAGKIILKATLARYARSLALSLKSGVPVMQALSTVAQTVDNDYIGTKIEKMREGVERGESVLQTSTAAGVFTPIVLQMVAVGEESGALDELMQEVAESYQREVEYELKTLSQQVEPILIVGLAVLVLILALGVFMPIWDLGSAMAK